MSNHHCAGQELRRFGMPFEWKIDKVTDRILLWTVALVLIVAHIAGPAVAQDGKLKKAELQQLLAPIALYPDDVLTNVLMAASYPLDVVEAARWRKQPDNAKLKGDALAKALEPQSWDPSIKALVPFGHVLESMSEKLDWTRELGDAFLGQQTEVMDEIQVLRAKAAEAGHLKSNEQQKVVKHAGTGSDARPIFVIEPANPEAIYVPVYQPSVVYEPWLYPDYPPYAWSYPRASFVNGFFWGAGVAVAGSIWGWNHFDWNRRNINIDVNKWNNINVNRTRITNNTWEHRPDHRGPVPYQSKVARDKFGTAARTDATKDFRGHDRATSADRAKAEARLKDTDHKGVSDHKGAKGKSDAKKRAEGKAGKGEHAKKSAKKTSNSAHRPPTKKSSHHALDVKRGSDVRRHVERGRSSHTSMASHRGGSRPHGGRAHAGGRRR